MDVTVVHEASFGIGSLDGSNSGPEFPPNLRMLHSVQLVDDDRHIGFLEFLHQILEDFIDQLLVRFKLNTEVRWRINVGDVDVVSIGIHFVRRIAQVGNSSRTAESFF